MAANLEDQLIDKVRALPLTNSRKRYDSLILLPVGLVPNLTERAWIAGRFGR